MDMWCPLKWLGAILNIEILSGRSSCSTWSNLLVFLRLLEEVSRVINVNLLIPWNYWQIISIILGWLILLRGSVAVTVCFPHIGISVRVEGLVIIIIALADEGSSLGDWSVLLRFSSWILVQRCTLSVTILIGLESLNFSSSLFFLFLLFDIGRDNIHSV